MTRLHLIIPSLLCLGLAGCGLTDPYQRPGNWRPLGVNDTNLAAMVVNPSDLVTGTVGSAGTDGQLAAAAVDRLRHDKVKTLGDNGGVADLKPIAVTVGGAAAGGSN